MCSSDRAVGAIAVLVSATSLVTILSASPARAARASWGDILIGGGGCENFDPSAVAQLYNPALNRFIRIRMNSGRSGAAAAIIRSGPRAGQILITGGDGGDGPLTTAEFYNPATSSFTTGPAMHMARVKHTATPIASGPHAGGILIAGGYGQNVDSSAPSSTEIYDPEKNSFIMGPKLRLGRFRHLAIPITSGANAGKILLAGGLEPAHHNPLSSTEIYDPSGEVVTGPPMNSSRAGATATPLGTDGARVLIAGGDDGHTGGENDSPVSSTELYDSLSNRFLRGSSMTIARSNHTATIIETGPNTGKVLIAGGQSVIRIGDKSLPDEVYSTELYDPKSGIFSPGPRMNFARSGQTATAIHSGLTRGEILIAEGTDSVPSFPAEFYDPAANRFMLGRHPLKGGCVDMFAIQLPLGAVR